MISALTTVFEYNVLRFHNGRLGAVNGMRPDGKVGCIVRAVPMGRSASVRDPRQLVVEISFPLG